MVDADTGRRHPAAGGPHRRAGDHVDFRASSGKAGGQHVDNLLCTSTGAEVSVAPEHDAHGWVTHGRHARGRIWPQSCRRARRAVDADHPLPTGRDVRTTPPRR